MLIWGLHGQVSVAGVYRGGFYEELPEASHVSEEPMPAGSKKDPSLAKRRGVWCDSVCLTQTCLTRSVAAKSRLWALV